jgi:diacylglycerol kinase family enzyme
MRVSLFHNQRAGDSTSLSWIRELIETSGHEIVRVFDREAAIAELLDERTELVVAAGGDGTVSAAARLLRRRPVPLAILPLGTANNIAKTLMGDASCEELVPGWNSASRRRIDVGVVRGVWGERRFLEAVGVGLVPASIVSTDNEPLSGNDVAANLASAIRRYARVLSAFEPRRWTLRLDGEEMSDDVILAEVLNTRSVGPNIVLSEDADPSDGYFSVVTAGEEHRDELARYLTDRLEGREHPLSLPERRARHIELLGQGDTHVDDELIRSAIPGALSIHIEPAAVEVLISDRTSG